MLQIALAGLVANNVLTLEEAEKIFADNKSNIVPKTVKEVLELINK